MNPQEFIEMFPQIDKEIVAEIVAQQQDSEQIIQILLELSNPSKIDSDEKYARQIAQTEMDEQYARRLQERERVELNLGAPGSDEPHDERDFTVRLHETGEKMVASATQFGQNARRAVMGFFDKVSQSIRPPDKSPQYSNLPQHFTLEDNADDELQQGRFFDQGSSRNYGADSTQSDIIERAKH